MKKEFGDHDQQRMGSVGIGDQRAEIAEPKHTPGPWRAAQINMTDKPWAVIGVGPHGDEIVAGYLRTKADADLIVTAVNSHADMIALARLFAKTVEYYIRADRLAGDDEGARLKTITLNMIRDTLARAEGR